MAGYFFPPPPAFIGGAQPYAPPRPDPYGVINTAAPPPVHPAVWPEIQTRQVLAWYLPPPAPPPVQLQGSITPFLSRDNPPFGLIAPRHVQNIAVQGWQPPPPMPPQPVPSAVYYPVTKPIVIQPIPPRPGPPPIFPHEDPSQDRPWSFWGNTQRQSEADRLKKMRQEIGLLPPDPPSQREQIEQLLDDPTVTTEFIVQQLSAHYFARYQTALRKAQARADLARENARKRQDYHMSSAERAFRTEQGKRLALRKLIEEDDAKVMDMIEKLLH